MQVSQQRAALRQDRTSGDEIDGKLTHFLVLNAFIASRNPA